MVKKSLELVSEQGYISRHSTSRFENQVCKVIPVSMQNVKVKKKKGCRAILSAPFSHMRRLVSLLAIFFFCPGTFASPGASPIMDTGSVSGTIEKREVRGLWVARESVMNREQAERLVRFADSLSINVLFVQARGRGDAWYRSGLVPGPEAYPLIPGTFDPLATLIPLCHARGIEVHAWLNLCLSWSAQKPPASPEHVLRSHPDWFMTSLNGLSMANCPAESVSSAAIEGRYLSPGLAPVREHLTRVVREIAERYAIDGVHLDYVRYPGWGYDFHPKVRNEFIRKFGVDPRVVVTGEGRADPRLTGLGKWVEFRAGKMDELVRDVSAAVRRVDPRLRVSAAVKADPEDAFYLYGQDWPRWIRESTVDFVVVMNFTAQNGIFENILRASLRKADRGKVVAGIGAWLLSPEQAEQQTAFARRLGLPGYCLFSYASCSGNPMMRKSLMKLARTEDKRLPSDFKPYLRKTR